MIDLCKIFGVEEGEEFELDGRNEVYKVIKNKLYRNDIFNVGLIESSLSLNETTETKVIKLPKKKEFTDDELCILRNIDKWYKWIARSRGNVIMLHNDKPYKDHNIWNSINCEAEINVFNHLFKSIKWEDEEPVFIDDYVERGVE